MWQDPREFSDDVSEDSGFEESVGSTDRKREQRLENDKYDMALEVRSTSQRVSKDLERTPVLLPRGLHMPNV